MSAFDTLITSPVSFFPKLESGTSARAFPVFTIAASPFTESTVPTSAPVWSKTFAPFFTSSAVAAVTWVSVVVVWVVVVAGCPSGVAVDVVSVVVCVVLAAVPSGVVVDWVVVVPVVVGAGSVAAGAVVVVL